MPGPATPNLGLTVPTNGGDAGLWGLELNADLAIIDNLGAMSVVNVASNYAAVASTFPETLIRVSTGVGNVTVTLPAPASVAGKIFTVKKVDSSIGAVIIVPASGTIDGGSDYTRSMQYGYVRLYSNGTSYDVIGNN